MFDHPLLSESPTKNVGYLVSAISIYERLLREYEESGAVERQVMLLDLCWANVAAERGVEKLGNVPNVRPLPIKVFIDLEFVDSIHHIQYPVRVIAGMWHLNVHARYKFGGDMVVMYREMIEGERVFVLYYGSDEFYSFVAEDAFEPIAHHNRRMFGIEENRETTDKLGAIGNIFKDKGMGRDKKEGVRVAKEWLRAKGYPSLFEHKETKCKRCDEKGRECWVGESLERQDNECYECMYEVQEFKCR
ncbi:hypothetical protein PQX77_019619 [Marasmius sp. AFHP31]|nr:hypothetical protein PQX77_019619 [Marasmius sp. AFHP31]